MNKKIFIIFSLFLVIVFFVVVFSKQGTTPTPPLFVYDSPKTNIKAPEVVNYSFSTTPTYPENLPTYSISNTPVEMVESVVLDAFPLFKTATLSSLFRDGVFTKTRTSSTGDLTFTVEKQAVVINTKEQGASTKSIAPPAIIITSLFSSMRLSSLISVVQDEKEQENIEGLLILDPKSTSVVGHTYSYKINNIPLYNPINPGPPATSIVDNLGVLRSLYIVVPPNITRFEKNVALISPKEILFNLRSNKGSIISASSPDPNIPGGDVEFSSFVISTLSLVYAETDTGMLSPAFLLHGRGSSISSANQEATYFLWATPVEPTH